MYRNHRKAAHVRFILKLLHDNRGVSTIEYCLLASLIGLGIVTGVQETGKKVAGGLEDAQVAMTDDAGEPGKGKKKGKRK